MSATILYLNTVSGDLIHGMKFAGIRRYAATIASITIVPIKMPF